MRPRVLARPVLVAAASALASLVAGCGGDESTTGPRPSNGTNGSNGSNVAGSSPFSSRPDDGYHPSLVVPPPTGEPVAVRLRVEDGLSFHSKGSYSFRQVAQGTFDAGPKGRPKKPPESRQFLGTLDLTRRVSLGGGTLLSRVEGTITIEKSEGDGAPSVGVHDLGLWYAEDGHGAAVHRTMRREVSLADRGKAGVAHEIAPDDLEILWGAFTEHFGPPERAVRVGDRLSVKEGMFIDDMLLRPTWLIWQRAVKALPQPTGAVWVDALENRGSDGTLVVRAAIRHENSGPTDPPPLPKDTVRVDYEAAIEARRRIALDGGWARSHDLTLRRRYRFRAPTFDYGVENEKIVRLETRASE